MRFITILLLTGLILSSCGTKGPLYIPEKQYPQDTTPAN
ncbi:MAG TPA: lipoprotein [Methylophilaceae bacterium]